MKSIITAMLLTSVVASPTFSQGSKKQMDQPIYGFTMKTIDGKDQNLSELRGKVIMLVNTASFCGYTPQYKDLEEVYKRYKEKDFVVIGFPANNFGKQEPGSDGDIAAFCEKNYGVTFPLFSKISVKGDDIHPLYKYLTTETPFKEEIKWNFTKFLVDKNGNVVARFESKVKPTDNAVISKINELVAQK